VQRILYLIKPIKGLMSSSSYLYLEVLISYFITTWLSIPKSQSYTGWRQKKMGTLW